MGFSVSASTAIIFAGLFLAVGTLYPAVSNAHERVTDAEIERTDARLDMRNTDITITAVDNSTPSVGVRNEGSTALNTSDLDFVIDGKYQSRDRYSPDLSEQGIWVPGETITFTGSGTIDDRVKVVTEHGISDSEAV